MVMSYVYKQYCICSYDMENALDFLEDEIDFTREEIKDMIQYTIDENHKKFIKYYNSLVDKFKYNFYEINCKKNKQIDWPKESGVYVIWIKTGDTLSFDDLIYVGMTGKFKRVSECEVLFNSGSFDKRKERWTPYRFCESDKDGKNKFSFRYGPLEKNTDKQSKIKYRDNAYKTTIPYNKLMVHCFKISEFSEDYTPGLLEKEILTKYLKSSGNLPPVNNEL